MTDALTAPPCATAAPLWQTLLGRAGENVFRCYQCARCASGCPLADEFDLTPNQVMRSLQLGDVRVLESRTIWLCASCQTCATRCPQGIDVTGVMDALRIEARRRGVPPAIPEIAQFNALFLRFVKALGRVPEFALLAAYNLVRRTPFADLAIGLRLLRRRRLKLRPHFARPPKTVAPLANRDNKVAYFPGCAALSSAADYDRTVRAAAAALAIELVEPPGWVCCGATPAHATDPVLAHALPLSAMATAERMGLDTMTSPCSNCFARLKATEYALAHDAPAAPEPSARRYGRGVRIQHILDTFVERAGLDGIKARVARPLRGLRVACYYGCLITRPSRITGAAHPEYPMKMDYLLRALGAETVDWSYKTECCGGALGITQVPTARKMSARVLRNAQACGAEAVVTMCPMCHLNLDARQPEMELEREIPVLHAPQLMALAFGLGADAAELRKNVIDPRPLLDAKGLTGPSGIH